MDDAMTARFDPDRNRLDVVFPDLDSLRRFAEQASAQSGFLLELPEALPLYRQVAARLSDGVHHLDLEVQVLQVFDATGGGHATAFQPIDPRQLEAPPREPAPASERRDDEMTGASPALRIRQMNPTQKMLLATKASRAERQILVRESSPQILMALLGNPRLEDRDVLEIVKSPHAAGNVLQRVAKDRRWAARHEVRLAVVKNPRTPTPLALQLLQTLHKKDLQVLARGSHVREAVKGAALRLYLKKL